MSKYLNINPIAKYLSIEHLKLNENESVDDLVQKLSIFLFDVYKKSIFDFAPEKQRKISTVKEKLKDTANSSSLKSLVAKIKDYSKETDISSSRYSDVKSLYIEGMEEVADSLKRISEIDPKIEDKIIKYFQQRTSKYVSSLESILKREKEEKEELNESVRLGLSGRAEDLKEKLRKILIPEAYGKTADNGYGRNWYRIFTELDQKLSVLDGKKEISNEKEKKILKDLEAQTNKLAKEFYTYCMRATETPFKKILSDEEAAKKFEEIKDMVSSAMDILTRAAAEESTVEDEFRDKTEGYDKKVTSIVFPIKIGDRDEDKKFKGSNLIANIQRALSNAFSPIKDAISKRGGVNGEFTPAFSAAIKSIQSVLGNKNQSGEIDRALLDVILDADKVSREDKDSIADSLDSLRISYVNESRILNSDHFFGDINEASVHIDAERLASEIGKNLADLSEPEARGNKKSALGYGERSDGQDQAYELAKLLRSKGFVNGIEEEDFLREDGTLRASYSPEFMIAWTKTAEDANKGDLPLYFWVNYRGSKIDGLYPTKRKMVNAKRPANWPKWKEIVGDTDESDVEDFSNWYTSYYSNFGGLDSDSTFELSKTILTNNKDGKGENEKIYDRLFPHLGTKRIKSNYISSEGMTAIKSAFTRASQMEEKIQDLSESDFGLLANLVAFTATTFTYNKKREKFESVLKIILDEIMTDSELKKLRSEESIGSVDDSSDFVAILDPKKGIRKANKQDTGSGESRNKFIFEENLRRAKDIHVPAVSKHIARMNAKTPDDLSRSQSKGIFIVPE